MVENNQFGCNVWTNQKQPVQYVQTLGGSAVDKQWKPPVCTSTVSALRMPPGLALPASSQQISRQAICMAQAEKAGWLKCVEPTGELMGAERGHGVVLSRSAQNVGVRNSAVSSDEYQQQQAVLVAQVQATLHALQNCPQQSVPTEQHPTVDGQVPAISQMRIAPGRFGANCRKPDDPQAFLNAQRPVYLGGKEAHPLPAAAASSAMNAAAISTVGEMQFQQSGDGVQQGPMLDLAKFAIGDGEMGVTVQPPAVPQQAFLQNLRNEPLNNQMGLPASRRLMPACFQASSQSFLGSPAMALNAAVAEKMQLEPPNPMLVHGPNLRYSQSAWNDSNPRQAPYTVPSGATSDQYNVVGRLTPVMMGPPSDMFCSSMPSHSQMCAVSSPVMVGSKFPR